MTKTSPSFVWGAQQRVCVRTERGACTAEGVSAGRLNSGGGVLSAAWSETAKQSGCGTATSTAEAPTDVCLTLTASQSCCIVGGSAADKIMLYEGGTYCK